MLTVRNEETNSMHYSRSQKHIPRMMNMQISSIPAEKQLRNLYQLNKELNLESHGIY